MKVNQWMKRYSRLFLWGAGLLILLAVFFSHMTGLELLGKFCYLTAGVPEVCIQKNYAASPEQTLALAAGTERASEHPLAQAVIRYAQGLPSYEAEMVQTIKGYGMEARINGRRVLLGNRRLMEQNSLAVSEQMEQDLAEIQSSG